MSELLTSDEAADYLRIGKSTIYALMQRGEVLGLRVGKRRLFTRTELDDYIAAREQAEQGRREVEFA